MKVNHLLIAGIATLGATALLTSCSNSKEKEQQQAAAAMAAAQAPQIATQTVEYGSSETNTVYPATIKGKSDVDVRPLVSGFVTQVLVDEGQYVTKGQTLFVLDQVQYQAAVDQAQAAVNAAQTAVSTAQLTADNKQRLFQKNIISEFEYQLAKNDLATARASLSQAQAALTNAKKNLSFTVVTAPSNGYIGQIPNREGSLASPSMAQPLTTVSDNTDIYAYFSLTEKDLLELSDNGTTSLQARINSMPEVQLRLSDGSIYPFTGKVATVSGVIDNNTGSASVRALFKNANGMLRSGATGQILFPNRHNDVIIIPQKATFEQQDKRFVFVVNDSNKVETRPIVVDSKNDGKTFVVLEGLKPGERIAVEGVGTRLSPGMEIVPVDAAEMEARQQAAQGMPQQAPAQAKEEE